MFTFLTDSDGNRNCSDPCNACGTDEDGIVTEDRCPTCNERKAGGKVCMSCENTEAWQKHIAENGVDIVCIECGKTHRCEGDWVKFCTYECAVANWKKEQNEKDN